MAIRRRPRHNPIPTDPSLLAPDGSLILRRLGTVKLEENEQKWIRDIGIRRLKRTYSTGYWFDVISTNSLRYFYNERWVPAIGMALLPGNVALIQTGYRGYYLLHAPSQDKVDVYRTGVA